MPNTVHYATTQHPFAAILIAEDEQGVCALLLGDNQQQLRDDLKRRFPHAELIEDGNQHTALLLQQVADFLDCPQQPLKLKLHLTGTGFQQLVWQVLQQIPLGSTMSYSEVAAAIGNPKAVRAVARACASNPVALAVACHRVLRSDGGISGYRWGIERKRKLLALERQFAPDGRGA